MDVSRTFRNYATEQKKVQSAAKTLVDGSGVKKTRVTRYVGELDSLSRSRMPKTPPIRGFAQLLLLLQSSLQMLRPRQVARQKVAYCSRWTLPDNQPRTDEK